MSDEDYLPRLTWNDLLQALRSVTTDDKAMGLAPVFMSGIRKQAGFLPPVQVITQLMAAAVILSEPDEPSHGGPPMSG